MFMRKKQRQPDTETLFTTNQQSTAQYGCAAISRREKGANDIIETPEWLCDEIYNIMFRYYDVSSLMSEKEYLLNSILDPCCGNGNMSKPFKQAGFKLITEFDILTGQDFSTYSITNKFDIIIMNPPFSNCGAERFIRKALLHLNPDGVIACITPIYILNNSINRSHEFNSLIDRVYFLDKNCFEKDSKKVLFHTALVFIRHKIEHGGLFLFDNINTTDNSQQLSLSEAAL